MVTARESGDRPLAFVPANDYLAVPKNFVGIRLEIFDRGAVPCSLLPPLAALRRLRSSGGDAKQHRAKRVSHDASETVLGALDRTAAPAASHRFSHDRSHRRAVISRRELDGRAGPPLRGGLGGGARSAKGRAALVY